MKIIDQTSKTNWKYIAIVAFIAVMVSVAGILLLKKMQTSPIFTLSKVEGWQTYRNEEYGFEVKYPEDWFNITDEERNQLSEPENEYEFSNRNGRPSFYEDGWVVFYIEVPFTDSSGTLFQRITGIKEGESMVSMINSDVVYTKIRNETVAGYTAVRYRSSTATSIRPYTGEVVLVKGDDYIAYFTLGGNFEYDLERNKQIFDQILSTFRFVP